MKREQYLAKSAVIKGYDFDDDLKFYNLMVGQAALPDSHLEISSHSLKEAAPEKDGGTQARAAVTRADKFVVILGAKKRYASEVKKEVAMATELGKTRFRIIGYTNGSRDWAVPDAGVTYIWNWPNLNKLLG